MFKIDLHVHTALGGDSVIQPQEVVGRARRLGLDAVCITEHHAYDLSQPFDEISIAENFPVFRGLEYRAEEGHLLIYGVRAGKGDLLPGLPMQTAVDWVNRRGGAAIPAHPYQAGMVGRALGDRVLQLTGIAAVETLNGSIQSEENRRARNAARQLGVQGIGGSDAHGIQALGNAYTVFFEPIEDEAGLVKALHAGRYSPEGSSADQRFNISEPQKKSPTGNPSKMKLSTRSRYSTRILLELAQQDDQTPIQVRAISDRQQIPPKYIEQLIRTLKRVGWISSRRGPKGGHYLSVDANTISLGDIVRLFEGQSELVGCIQDVGSCPKADQCTARLAWQGATRALFEKLDNVTIADLICDPPVID